MMNILLLVLFLVLLLPRETTASGPKKEPNNNNDKKNDNKNPISSTTCQDTCIDFSMTPDGKVLQHGDYVKYEWYDEYGLIIDATSNYGGYTPDGMARIYDTELPNTEDPDLASPNEKCPKPGPGVGNGGTPNKPGANCEPQGNVLIIQEENKHHKPDDNAYGGTISFTFEATVDHVKIGLMDLDGPKAATLTVETAANQKKESFEIRGLGDNSIQEEEITMPHIKSVSVSPKNSCGIRFVCFCKETTMNVVTTTFVPPNRPPPFTSAYCPSAMSTLEEIKTILETTYFVNLDLPTHVEHMQEFHTMVRSYLSKNAVPDRDLIYYLWKTPYKTDPRAVSRQLVNSERQLVKGKPCVDALSSLVSGVMTKALSLFGISNMTADEAGRMIGVSLVENLDNSELAALVQDLKNAGPPDKVAEAILKVTFQYFGAGGVITMVADATPWWDWLIMGVPVAAQVVAAVSSGAELVREMQAPYGVNDVQTVVTKCS